MPHRLRPLANAFLDNLPYGLIAMPLTYFWAIYEQAVGVYAELLTMSVPLLAFAIAMFIGNTVIGTAMSLWAGHGFSYDKAGKFFAKTTRYVITVSVFTMIANASMEVGWLGMPFSYLGDFALFIAGIREGSSVTENLYGMTLDQMIIGAFKRVSEYAALPSEHLHIEEGEEESR